VIIYTPDGRPLMLSDDDLFTSTGVHVGRVYGKVVCGPSGRYVGTLEEDRLVFQDGDSLTSQPMFVRLSHPGFVHDHYNSLRTIDGEPQFDE
jgi:hypothetical protein